VPPTLIEQPPHTSQPSASKYPKRSSLGPCPPPPELSPSLRPPRAASERPPVTLAVAVAVEMEDAVAGAAAAGVASCDSHGASSKPKQRTAPSQQTMRMASKTQPCAWRMHPQTASVSRDACPSRAQPGRCIAICVCVCVKPTATVSRSRVQGRGKEQCVHEGACVAYHGDTVGNAQVEPRNGDEVNRLGLGGDGSQHDEHDKTHEQLPSQRSNTEARDIIRTLSRVPSVPQRAHALGNEGKLSRVLPSVPQRAHALGNELRVFAAVPQ
jgi:hypothetical protein